MLIGDAAQNGSKCVLCVAINVATRQEVAMHVRSLMDNPPTDLQSRQFK